MKPFERNVDVIILGGGIIGALSAFELAKNGRSVLLLDTQKFGTGASGNSAAMLEYQLDYHRGDPFNSLAKASMDLFPPLHKEIQALTGIDFHLDICGILQLALDETDADFLRQQVDQQVRDGLTTEWLDADEVRRRYPSLTIPTQGAALFGGDGQVDGNAFLTASLESARRKGAELHDSLGTISLRNEKTIRVETPDFTATGKSLVIAAGAWTDQILSVFGFRTGIEPVRGQLIVHETKTAPLPHPVYTRTGGYITPKQGGYTLAGTTVERAGFDSSTTPAGRDAIRKTTDALMPSLASQPVLGMTAGLRPHSPDELPLIGFLPSRNDVFVAAGHYRNGVMLAPITSRIVAAAVAGTPLPIDISPFSPLRCLTAI